MRPDMEWWMKIQKKITINVCLDSWHSCFECGKNQCWTITLHIVYTYSEWLWVECGIQLISAGIDRVCCAEGEAAAAFRPELLVPVYGQADAMFRWGKADADIARGSGVSLRTNTSPGGINSSIMYYCQSLTICERYIIIQWNFEN